jgi:FecR-like protein
MRGAELLLGAIVAAVAVPVLGQNAPAQVGTVTHLSGVLVAKTADGGTRLLSVKSAVAEGETLTTEQNTYARLKFEDDAEIVLRPSTQLKIDSYQYQSGQPERDNALLSLLKGGLRSVTGLLGRRSRDKVRFSTATATIGIRGTHFGMLLCQNDCASIPSASGPPENGLHVDVVDGAITLTNPAGQQVLVAGQYGYVRDLNTAPAIVPAGRGIQVTMPPSISRNAGTGKAIGKSSDLECPVM